MQHRVIIILGILASVTGLFVLAQFVIIKYNGTEVAVPEIPRQPQTYGSGPKLNYVVLGDSTAVSQGSNYEQGVAVRTAQHLSTDYTVEMTNYGVSGARAADVAEKQVQQITTKPDLVLIMVGSNDVTHLTSMASVRASLDESVKTILKLNCDAKIVLTGAAQMGSVVRFPQPVRWLAGVRSNQLNSMFRQFSEDQNLTFAEIALKTGDIFKGNPTMFAQDKFHPSAKGYEVWTEVLNQVNTEALNNQQSHCREVAIDGNV